MAAYDFPLLLKHLLEHGVVWGPHQEIIYRDQHRYTYTNMAQRVLKLASALQELGVQKGTKVGVIEWDSHRYLELYFAIPGIGAILHTINPNLAPENVIYTMQHAEDEILIFHEDFMPLVEQVRKRIKSLKKYLLIRDSLDQPDIDWVYAEYEAFLNASSPLSELPDFDERTQATLSYTTGTTGLPKGVYFSHRQLVLQTYAGWGSLAIFGNYGGIQKHDVYMPLTPLFHVHGWGWPYVATAFGLKQVYPGKYDYELILWLVSEEGVTLSHCVPTILQRVITHPSAKDLDLTGWKVIIGGARLPKGLALAAEEIGMKLTGAYGLSESCPLLTLANLKPFMEKKWNEEDQLDMKIKTGVPMPLVKIRVVDPDGKDVAHDGNETGEIIARSPWLTPGYYKDTRLTKELWTGGWMHTGDVAHVDKNGYIQIVDRIKDIIKSGGEWIASLELENLLSLHEDVLEAGVIGVPDERWGERPLAVIAPVKRAQSRLNAEVLQNHLQKYVEEGVITKWAVPELYIFMDKMPKTSVGKIDKQALRKQFAQQPKISSEKDV
jgi:fatty-acyl-CoA synthase